MPSQTETSLHLFGSFCQEKFNLFHETLSFQCFFIKDNNEPAALVLRRRCHNVELIHDPDHHFSQR